MHTINIVDKSVRTDLIIEKETFRRFKNKELNFKGIKVSRSNNDEGKYSTILFKDISDIDNFKKVQNIFVRELREFINVTKNDSFLIIGLGNKKSTPDSLGPKTINQILVTGYLFLLGEVEDGYSNVSTFTPDVTGNTGLETADIIKSVIEATKATKVIVIDALKTNNMNRLTKTIQITNCGISPGSGIGNTRKEISKKTMGIDIIAIGVPTVVDINNIIEESIGNSFIVTPTDIDFIIEKLSMLLGNGLNILLHNNFIRQNNY